MHSGELLEHLKSLTSWTERLQNEARPIILYGMGDGAQKIFSVLESRGITVCGVMASDEFLRGQTFLGNKVLSEHEATEKFGDFVAVLCFALRGELTETALDFSKRHTLISPNIAVAGDEICDKEYILKNIDRFLYIYEKFADDESRKVFLSILEYNVTGDISYLFKVKAKRLPIDPKGKAYVDVGAYDGDTVLELLETGVSYSKIFAFEPDLKNYKKMVSNTAHVQNVFPINAAVGEKCEKLRFSNEGSMNSHLGEGESEIDVKTIDSLSENIGAIKIDAEGLDKEVLYGAVNTICDHHPEISVAVYHRAGDIYDLGRLLLYYYPKYKLYLRKVDYIPPWDIFITAK